jgi:hypothetical protein
MIVNSLITEPIAVCKGSYHAAGGPLKKYSISFWEAESSSPCSQQPYEYSQYPHILLSCILILSFLLEVVIVRGFYLNLHILKNAIMQSQCCLYLCMCT